MKKRILPALLALCMVISLLPVAFAADEEKVSCTDVPAAGEVLDSKTVKITVKNEDNEDVEVDCAVTVKVGTVAEKTAHVGKTCGAANCTCYTKGAVQEGTATKGEDGKYTRTDTVNYTFSLCDACKANATCNPCGKGGCTLLKGHDDGDDATDHEGQTSCSNDAHCTFKGEHNKTCTGNRCDVLDAEKGVNTGTGDANTDAPDGIKCTLSKGHTGPHNNTACTGKDGCGAATHFQGIKAVTEEQIAADTDKDGWVKKPCPTFANSLCGMGGCTLPKGHSQKVHENSTCLGYNSKGTCKETLVGDGKHIKGCDYYVCECGNHTEGTHKAVSAGSDTTAWKLKFAASSETVAKNYNCALCAEWNAYVKACKAKYDEMLKAWEKYDALSDAEKAKVETAPKNPGTFDLKACTCADCAANPSMGAVVDAEGNEVDPAEPTEPTETPTKVEDFKDADKMDDWMKEAAQVMLDEGWMEGTGDSFEPREDADTNVVLTVIARMSGETITGTTWKEDAKAWADENELTEGIDTAKADIARKDIVLMLWRLAGKPSSDFELTFTDVDGLEGDHLTAMKWAAENKIVVGNGDDTVTPDGTLKRAELAVLAARYAALKK